MGLVQFAKKLFICQGRVPLYVFPLPGNFAADMNDLTCDPGVLLVYFFLCFVGTYLATQSSIIPLNEFHKSFMHTF